MAASGPGIDDRPVVPNRELKQISRELTFPRDVEDRGQLRHSLDELAQQLTPAIRDGHPARTLTLKMRHTDLSLVTRRRVPGTVVSAEVLATLSGQIFEGSWDGRPLRLLGLGVSSFISSVTGRPALFDLERPRNVTALAASQVLSRTP